MPERPPRGYDRRDKPLPHYFVYEFGLDSAGSTRNATMATYLRTSKISNDPSTIEVNPRNAAFAVDTGALICEESIVQKMTINKTIAMSAAFAAQVPAVTIQNLVIAGCFEDSWSPADERSGATVESIIEVTDEPTTNMDVTPKWTATALAKEEDQPFSTITGTENFTEYNMSSSTMKSVAWNTKAYFDARKFYTNGNKMASVAPILKTRILNSKKQTYIRESGQKFVPKQCQFGRRDNYFGEMFHVPFFSDPEQIIDSFTTPSSAANVIYEIIVSFNEWNPLFDQKL